MTDLTLTRIGLAEHEYPTPTRNILSEQQRERSKRIPSRTSEVRYGYRAKDGTNYMFPTATERDAARKADLANKAFERAERQQRLQAIVSGQSAEVDSWAHKS